MVFLGLGGTPRCPPRRGCTFRGELGFSCRFHAVLLLGACRSLFAGFGLQRVQQPLQLPNAIRRNAINLCRILCGCESGTNNRRMSHDEVMLHLFDADVTGKYSSPSRHYFSTYWAAGHRAAVRRSARGRTALQLKVGEFSRLFHLS